MRPGWPSGGKVGALHGVEPVDGVPHAGLQGAHVRGSEEAVAEAGEGGIAIDIVEDGVVPWGVQKGCQELGVGQGSGGPGSPAGPMARGYGQASWLGLGPSRHGEACWQCSLDCPGPWALRLGRQGLSEPLSAREARTEGSAGQMGWGSLP